MKMVKTTATRFTLLYLVAACLCFGHAGAQTYAERLGYPKEAKVLILHVDDAGMS